MKKQLKLIPFIAITALAVVGCSSKYTKITNGKDNYLNKNLLDKSIDVETLQELYDALFSASGNATIQHWLVNQIIELEEIQTSRASDITERLDKFKEEWLKNDAYYVDYIFNERKLVTSLRTIGYEIVCENGYFTAPSKNVNPYSLGEPYNPATYSAAIDNYKLTLHADDDDSKPSILKCNYSDYENKTALPSIYQDLIKEQYIKLEQLTDLLDLKRVREFKIFELAFDNNDPNVSKFIDKMNEAITKVHEGGNASDIDFSIFAPRNIAEYPNVADDYFYYKNILDEDNGLNLESYEKIWKVYKKQLIQQEIDKMGYLGPLAEETEASKNATDEEKKNLVNKYSGNNTYSTEEGEWLANYNVDKVEYVKTKVYTTESSPLTSALNNYAFSKGREEAFINEKLEDVEGHNFFTSLTNSGDFYHVDNSGQKYQFIEVLNLFEDPTELEKNEITEAFLERASVDAAAFVFFFDKYNLIIGDKDYYEFIKANYPKYFE